MKVKEHFQKQQEKKFELDLSFAQWLDYYMEIPTEDELNLMEQSMMSDKPTIQSLSFTPHPLNNTYYQPLQGA